MISSFFHAPATARRSGDADIFMILFSLRHAFAVTFSPSNHAADTRRC